MSKMIPNLLFDPAEMGTSCISLTMQCLKNIMVTPLCPAYLRAHIDRHQNREYASLLSNMILIYCLNLHK